MTLAEAIAKVAKLRALAASTTPGEAANAAAAADRIMQEYRISEASLEASGDPEMMPDPTTDAKIPLWNQRITHWQLSLMTGIARNYDCSLVSNVRQYDGGKWSLGVHIFGRASDIEIVKSTYAYLALEVVRLAAIAGKGKGKAWSTSFCMGASAGIREAMAASKRDARIEVAASTALTVLDDRYKLARKALDSYYPSLRSGRGGSATDYSAYSAGEAAGRGISTSRVLPDTTRGLLK